MARTGRGGYEGIVHSTDDSFTLGGTDSSLSRIRWGASSLPGLVEER